MAEQTFNPWEFQDANGNLDLGPHWTPPPSLTVAILLAALKDTPRPWLADVINLMEFGREPPGKPQPPEHRKPLESDTTPEVTQAWRDLIAQRRQTGQRMRAAKALFAAGQQGRVKFRGSPAGEGNRSEPMPEDYFDIPRMLGHEDNTIEFDVHSASMDEYAAAGGKGDRRGKYEKWWNVRVERASFADWQKSVLVKFRHGIDLSALIRAEYERKGCNLQHKEAAKIAKASGELIPREIIKKVLKLVQGPPRRGRPPLPK